MKYKAKIQACRITSDLLQYHVKIPIEVVRKLELQKGTLVEVTIKKVE